MRQQNKIIFAGLLAALASVSVFVMPASATWIEGDTAQLQALDKITARISTLIAPINKPIDFGTLSIVVKRCAYHPPEDTPEDAGFLNIVDRGHDKSAPGKRVFSGWMFSSSPAISALEHPVYDITLLACVSTE